MKKKPIFATFLLLLFLSTLWIAKSSVALSKADIYIVNQSGTNLIVSYFASGDGEWLKAPSYSPDASNEGAILARQNFYRPADFSIAVGNHLDNFLCTADLHENALSRKLEISNVQGHCRFENTTSGQSLILEKVNSETAKQLI